MYIPHYFLAKHSPENVGAVVNIPKLNLISMLLTQELVYQEARIDPTESDLFYIYLNIF